MRSRREAGFALIAALWALVLVGTVAAAYLMEARHVVRVSENRNAELRARLAALSGLERAHNVLERLHLLSLDAVPMLDLESQARLTRVWNNLGDAFEESATECVADACFELTVRDLGAVLNVNAASEERLRRFFVVLGVDYRKADVAAQSIADWIDVDDLHRARGAERDYYAALPFPHQPRNGPIDDVSELQDVRGMEGELFDLSFPLLTTEGDGKVNLNAAPEPVLATLPGVGREALSVILDARRRGIIFSNAFELSLRLSPQARGWLQEQMSEFMQIVVFEPRQIEVTSTGRSGDSGVRVAFKALYVRSGERVALVKRTRKDR